MTMLTNMSRLIGTVAPIGAGTPEFTLVLEITPVTLIGIRPTFTSRFIGSPITIDEMITSHFIIDRVNQ